VEKNGDRGRARGPPHRLTTTKLMIFLKKRILKARIANMRNPMQFFESREEFSIGTTKQTM
jgi:hypothetical protein